MGLRPLDLDTWIEVDDEYESDLDLKAMLIAERPSEVIAALATADVDAASEELWSMVSADAPAPSRRADLHPIARCGLSTQEDWVVMVPSPRGPVLGAACVCFPSRWVLAEKLGRTNREIHAPIGHYEEHVAQAVDSFFDRISVEHPMWRLNWNLFDDPTLYQPRRVGIPPAGVTFSIDDVADRVWLRVERQTLRRLPQTGSVAFGIRIHQRPIRALAAGPGVLDRLRLAINALPEDTFQYKGLGGFSATLIEWISGEIGEPTIAP